ncbi:FRG domain-containing protein [Lysinibacillus sphaericus]|uniref:FRG domain-containing protein n=1 Tax=Lysinibacillus sphaericus TaxID=1421 RepID=UPI003801E205
MYTEKKFARWIDLQEELFNFERGLVHNRFRTSLAYRGVGDAEYDLKTSLMRLENDTAEKHLLRNFKKYAGKELNYNDNVWELLAVAQHYGLPTRLLDWSFSPYVALHFATSDTSKYKKDGAIWCMDITKVNELLPAELKGILNKEGSHVFTVELLKDYSLEQFDNLKSTEDNKDFIVCLEPPSIDERIVNQYAMFTIISDNNKKLDELMKEQPNDIYTKIIIPKELKMEIRDKLDQANISERIIYPGLEGISAWLKRYYTKFTDNNS